MMATTKAKPTSEATATGQQPNPPTADQTNATPPTGGQPNPPTADQTNATPPTGDQPNAAEALMAEKTVTLPVTPVRVFLARVKKEWPHSILQSAGIIFPREGAATPIREDAPEFAELRANPYLDLNEQEA